MSVKEGIRKYGQKRNDSVMKEIRNLAEKNSCFGEIEYETLTQEMKDKALPLLMFMIMKRLGDLKTRGVTGNRQRLYIDKSKCLSPTPDFYSLKYLCAVFAKEGQDVATVDLPRFFLQTENEGLVLLKMTSTVVLLLVELNSKK